MHSRQRRHHSPTLLLTNGWACFDNCSLHFVNWGETLLMVDCLLKSTPHSHSHSQMGSNPGYLVDKMFGSVNWRFSRCRFLCFWPCERERRPAAVTICNGHILPWCLVASLCQALRHMVSNFPPSCVKTTSVVLMRNTATFWTDFTDLNLYWIKGALAFVCFSFFFFIHFFCYMC